MRFAAFWDERTASDLRVAGIPDPPLWGRPGWPWETGRGRRGFLCPEGPPSPRISPDSNKAHAEWKFKDFTWKQRSGVLRRQSYQNASKFCSMPSINCLFLESYWEGCLQLTHTSHWVRGCAGAILSKSYKEDIYRNIWEVASSSNTVY